jgi:F-type H+-transporting ATPase subunit b
MAERQRLLENEVAEREAKQRQVDEEWGQVRTLRAELEATRSQQMEQAAADAEQRRREMVRDARAEVEEMQARWYDAVEHERDRFLQTLRRRLGEQMTALCRQSLADLATVRLEQAMVESALEQLADTGLGTRQGNGQRGPVPVVVRSAHALSPPLRERLVEALQMPGGARRDHVSFVIDESLICGVEVELPNRRLGWNVRDYLGGIDDRLQEAFAAGQ